MAWQQTPLAREDEVSGWTTCNLRTNKRFLPRSRLLARRRSCPVHLRRPCESGDSARHNAGNRNLVFLGLPEAGASCPDRRRHGRAKADSCSRDTIIVIRGVGSHPHLATYVPWTV